MSRQLKLSILDQSVISGGGDATGAVHETIALARAAENWGYHRFWVSEHHNLNSIAGSSPEVLMVRLGDVTKNIRIGSGGVMLPNHSALKVAENFRLLETLFPGRIDLGIGRAPGGDRMTASLLNPSNDFTEEGYIQQLDHLQIFFRDEGGTEYGNIVAVPQSDTMPQQWMLSSGGGSSRLAARYGMGLAVAKFINGFAPSSMVKAYKDEFMPSELFPEPRVAVSSVVLCADTEEKAMQLRKAVDYHLLQMEKRRFHGIKSYEEIKDYKFSFPERQRLKAHKGRIVSGTPSKVKEDLEKLAEKFDADEIIAVCWAADFEDRKRSFELLADEFGIHQRFNEDS